MTDYPVLLCLEGRRCVVVGAGPVGLHKVRGLVEAGAETVLIAPDPPADGYSENVEIVPRFFTEDDLIDTFLVIAATDDVQTNQRIAAVAQARSVLVNVVDNADLSDFTMPAIFRNGDLVVAVATGGVSPAVAVMVRDDIEKNLSEQWQIFLEIAGTLRARLLTSSSKAAYNQQVLRNIVSHGVLAMLADADVAGIDRLLETEFGKGYSLADLGISLSKGSK